MTLKRRGSDIAQTSVFILGDCLDSRLFALRLRLRFGVRVTLCDQSRCPWGFLLPVGAFRRIYSEDLIELQLLDMAAILEDVSPFLLCANEGYRTAVNRIKASIEGDFVLTDKNGLLSFMERY